MTPNARARALVALCALAAGAFAGCGLGAGEERDGAGVELRVTRDFGQRELASHRVTKVREGDTVMRLLRSREQDVEARYGGKFVQSIGSLSGGGATGSEDWFYFVNGIEAGKGAADFELSPGDVVQWDFRDYSGAMRVPAIVGAWPEPFVHGNDGKRLPVRIECEDDGGKACKLARAALDEAGVEVTGAALGAPAGDEVLRVVVARWERAREVRAASVLADEPARSGVFARFRDDRLELLAPDGRPAETAPPGTGLVAATTQPGQGVVWVLTGLTNAAVEHAAAALDERSLRNRFAVAAGPAAVRALPLRETRR